MVGRVFPDLSYRVYQCVLVEGEGGAVSGAQGEVRIEEDAGKAR